MQGVSFGEKFDVGIVDNGQKSVGKTTEQENKFNMYFSVVAVAERPSHGQDFPI
jgi:hypothetical protein